MLGYTQLEPQVRQQLREVFGDTRRREMTARELPRARDRRTAEAALRMNPHLLLFTDFPFERFPEAYRERVQPVQTGPSGAWFSYGGNVYEVLRPIQRIV